MQRFPPGSCMITVRNFLTFVVFASEKSLLLVINMAFADTILGAVSMPLCVFLWIGPTYWLWNYKKKLSLDISWSVVYVSFSQGSLISAAAIAFKRCYAIYWPLKHRTMSFKAYYIIIFIIRKLALSAVFNIAKFLISSKTVAFFWMSFSLPSLFIICACSIGIWRKFQLRNFTATKQSLPKQTLDANSASRVHHFSTVTASISHNKRSYLFP